MPREIRMSRKTKGTKGNKNIQEHKEIPPKQNLGKSLSIFSQLRKPKAPTRPEIFGSTCFPKQAWLCKWDQPNSRIWNDHRHRFFPSSTSTAPTPKRLPVNPCLTVGNTKGSGIPLKFSGIAYSRLGSWENQSQTKE